MSDRDVTVAPDDYTAKLMAELVQVMEERDTLLSKFKLSQEMRHGEHEQYSKESAKLRELVRISIVYCNAGLCDECPIRGDDGYCPFADMALELGVEVD